MASQPPADFTAHRQIGVSARALLQNKDLRLLLASNSPGYVCLGLEMLALGLLVLDRTDSAWQVALVGVFRLSPLLFFGMFSGLIADLANRWRVMVLARSGNVLVTAALFSLLVTDRISTWHVMVGALALGWLYVLDSPSRHSYIYDLVGPQNVVRAMSLETINITVGSTLGPVVAGLFVELKGFSGAYLFLLVVYILALFLISRVKSRIARPPSSRQPMWRMISGGLRYSLQNRTVLGVLGLTVLINAAAFSAIQLFPVVARDHLHVGPGLTGILVGASWFGTLLGAAIITYIGPRTHHGRIFVVGTCLHFITLLLFSLSPWYPLSALMLLLAGLGTSGYLTMQTTIILTSAPPERRGMAMGVLVLCYGSMPLGLLQMGALAVLLNAQTAIGINAAAGLLLALPMIIRTPLVWRPITAGAEQGDSLGDTPTTA